MLDVARAAAPTRVVAPPSPAAEVASAPTIVTQASQVAVALFDGEVLDYCASSAVEFRSPAGGPPAALTIDQAALLMLDEALVINMDGQGTLGRSATVLNETMLGGLTSDAARMKKALVSQFTEKELAEFKAAKKRRAKPEPSAEPPDVFAFLRIIAWPLDSIRKKVEKGEAAKVESCAFPSHTALGACRIEGVAANAEPYALKWSIEQQYFSMKRTSESDSAMKRCLMLGGQWKAPAKDDPDAARERLRQRAGQLRAWMGSSH